MIQGVVDRKEGVGGGEVETGRGRGREGEQNGIMFLVALLCWSVCKQYYS